MSLPKVAGVLVFALFAVAITYQVINRLSADALNVAIGVLCGMVASVPVSLGLFFVLWRRQDRAAGDTTSALTTNPIPSRVPQPPQIIVVAPPQNAYAQPVGNNSIPNFYAPPEPEIVEARQWHIIGDEE